MGWNDVIRLSDEEEMRFRTFTRVFISRRRRIASRGCSSSPRPRAWWISRGSRWKRSR